MYISALAPLPLAEQEWLEAVEADYAELAHVHMIEADTAIMEDIERQDERA